MNYRRPVWVEVKLNAVAYNVQIFRKIIGPDTLFMAVVKTDGYGHGAIPVAKAALASGANRLGVALVEEGVELRKDGITAPIHLLSLNPISSTQLIVENNLIPTVCHLEFAKGLSQEAQKANKTIKVHIKVDTGMNRIGIKPEEALPFLKEVISLPGIQVEGVFTHFALADNPQSSFTEAQFNGFNKMLDELEKNKIEIPIKHAANSTATVLFPQTHLDMVRIGILLYGLHPSDATRGKIDIQPAFVLKARVSSVKNLSEGEGISYGHTYYTLKPTTIATLPLGYGDGYSRLFSSQSEVLIGGKRKPIVGVICMDQLMVNAGAEAETEVGDEAVLIGKQGEEEITVDELASVLDTINYEIVCMINKRVPRVYRD